MDYKFIQIDGTYYAVPPSMKDDQLALIAGQMLQLRRMEYICDQNYNKSFHYLEEKNCQIRIGVHRGVYETEIEAKTARDLHNKMLDEAKVAETS
jgi:4-hydroxy-3-methylbut-2-en-1-yl diphosphate synthase IspG/GcpE